MTKARLILIVDALLVVSLSAILGIGLLIKYVLVAGVQRWEIYGRNVNLLLWGMDRHQWGSIHLVLGGTFFVFLAIHVLLHWSILVRTYNRVVPSRTVRRIIAIAIICLAVVLATFGVFVNPEMRERRLGQGGRRGGVLNPTGQDKTWRGARFGR